MLNFNREWRFELGDPPRAEEPAFDDSRWDPIGLPHSFSIPYFQSAKFYQGYGWYRKRFSVPVAWSHRRLFLEFDGAFQDAEVFVNGTPVGRHQGGYTGFSIDISGAAHVGNNLVAVRLNNLWNPRLAPRAGEHVFSGGIYRDVRLVVTSALHVAWCGTFVTTPQVSAQSATVHVQTEVRNDAAAPATFTLQTEIHGPDGKTVASVASPVTLAAGSTRIIEQSAAPIAQPRLWSPEHPALYSAVSTLIAAHSTADRFQTNFGIRWFRWTADQGFFLNGQHYYFKGANVHQDHAGWGDAVTDAGLTRDVQMVKDAGFDFIRGSHYPHAPAFADACDRIGMLFWSENCFWGSGGRQAEGSWSASAYPIHPEDEVGFEESVRRSLTEEIRINRNHPSIVVWSMDNEVFFSASQTLPKVRALLTSLVDLTHRLDPTRPAAIGGAQRGNIDRLGDIAGYNGDGARLFKDPGIPNAVTEYGSTIAVRPGSYAPGWGDLPMSGQDKSQAYPWRYPWRSGEVIWCAFDHGSIAGSRFGSMGMVDYFRLPKRQWYWYRNEYLHIPPPTWPQPGIPAGLRLSADKTTLPAVDGTDDTRIIVTVVDSAGNPISNAPPITLTVESGPAEFPTGPSITFDPESDIAIRDGRAAIEVRAYYAGKSVIRAASPGLPGASIAIIATGGPDWIPGRSPATKPRPYVRFTGPPAATPEQRLGRDNPTSASTEADGHPARLANDNDPATYWSPRADDSATYWQVDLERICRLTRIRLDFGDPGAAPAFLVSASLDARTWTTLLDETRAAPSERTYESLLGGPATARYRFVRISFPDHAAAASEMRLSDVDLRGVADAP